jgi:arginine deiminase
MNKQEIRDKEILDNFRKNRDKLITEINAMENKIYYLQNELKKLVGNSKQKLPFNQKYVDRLDNIEKEYTKYGELFKLLEK